MKLGTADIRSVLETAELIGPGEDRLYEGVCTDTRLDCRDRLFVALSGDKHDANSMLSEAAKAGAAGAVIGPTARRYGIPGRLQCFLVEDTLAALQELGGWARRQVPELETVGITGSNGKSTTKEMTAAVLGTKYRTHATSGNFNNHIGVPLTLLGLEPDDEALAVEIGANHPGEVATLAKLARPIVSVITNVAPAHLEGFGSVEGVLEAKLELFENTSAGGRIIYNSDNELLSATVPRRFENTLTFGTDDRADIRALDITLDSSACPVFRVNRELEVRLSVPGRHNVYNALAAVAVGRTLGIRDSDIAGALDSVRSMKMRTELKRIGGLRILDDSYNANPLSMREALNTLESMQHEGPRGVVAGEMLELGPGARSMHEELARLVADCGLKPVVFVGNWAGRMKEAFLAQGGDSGAVHAAADAEEACTILRQVLSGGELLLVKGSRGVRLERTIKGLEEEFA